MDIKQFDKISSLKCEWSGEIINLQVKENAVSPLFMQTLRDSQENPIKFAEALALVIVGWDVTSNGNLLEPTAENLAALPLDFLTTLSDAISATWTGDKKKQTELPNG